MTVAPRLAFCPLLVTSIGPDLFALTLFADTAVHPLPHKKEQGSMKYDVLVPFLCTSLPFCSLLTLPWACPFAPAAWAYGAFIFRARRTLRMGCVCFFHFLNWDHLRWAASLEQRHGHKHGCDVDAEELRVPHEKALLRCIPTKGFSQCFLKHLFDSRCDTCTHYLSWLGAQAVKMLGRVGGCAKGGLTGCYDW